MKEQHLYIPPDAQVASNGQVAVADWSKLYRFGNLPDRLLLSFTGMGMPSISYITQSGPGQPGETILDFNVEPRYIQYVHARKGGCNRMAYWDARQNIGKLLSPARQSPTATNFMLGRLRVILPNGTMRDIDAIIEQGPAFEPREPTRWMETTFIETLRFKCPDPTWYDPVTVETVWVKDIYEGLIFYEDTDYPDNLTFPDNAIFDSDVVTATTEVTYTGTWFGYPIIYITGPIYAPSIENTTLGQKIALEYSVAAGEIITINTTYGRKSVVNNFGADLLGTLSSDSSLKFFLAHDPYAIGGVNSINVSGSGADANTAIQMSYFTRYIMI